MALQLSAAAQAADSLVFAGVEASRIGSYAYLGHLSPIGQGSLGNGWLLRHWVDRLTYRYDSGDQTIHAESYAYSPAIGRGFSGDGWSSSIYAGLRLAHTGLSPDDQGNTNRGNHDRAFVQADGINHLSQSLENQYLVQLDIGNGGYYARERLLYHWSGQLYAGPEFILKGAREYNGWQTGLVVGGMPLSQSAHLAVKAGVSGQRGESSVAYYGTELTVSF